MRKSGTITLLLTSFAPVNKILREEKMKEKRMPTVQSNENWKKENTIQLSLRLMKKTEADIMDALESSSKSRRARFLELLRLGIAYEQQGGAIQGVSAPAPAPSVDRETQRLARVGAEYEDMLRRGWVMVEPEKKEETASKSVHDALSRLQQVMEERRAREAQQEEQEQKEEEIQK